MTQTWFVRSFFFFTVSLKLIFTALVTFKKYFIRLRRWFFAHFVSLVVCVNHFYRTKRSLFFHGVFSVQSDVTELLCALFPTAHTIFLLAVANLRPSEGNPQRLECPNPFSQKKKRVASRHTEKKIAQTIARVLKWSSCVHSFFFRAVQPHIRGEKHSMEYWWLFSELISVMNWQRKSSKQLEFLEISSSQHIQPVGRCKRSEIEFPIHSEKSGENVRAERENEENSLVV